MQVGMLQVPSQDLGLTLPKVTGSGPPLNKKAQTRFQKAILRYDALVMA